MITPAQCKAARQLLGWDFAQLSSAASLYYLTITSFESCSGGAHQRTRKKLRTAFEGAGIEFHADGSARLREDGEG